MSPARTPMPPPRLEGYEYQRLLGSGGYSDVFLYKQVMPLREVAIKVLVTEGLGDAGRDQFQLEANAMASVSTHPFIVTVFHAGLSDLGQPYLVMEYYPQPNFSVRARSEQLAIAEVLRVGVQIASAVETAHRAGILHRDIKPANILTSEYNRPGLTDFGIATTVADDNEAEGMSIPWAPPEVINGSAPGDVTADVYSLGATIYTLLAGRSPFEVPGGANKSLDLVTRIEKADLPPTARPDVPSSLERVLRHAMSPRPQDRPGSALDLARMLQEIEIEQGWSSTQLEVRDDSRQGRSRTAVPDDDGTRLKSPTVIESQGAPGLIDRIDVSTGGTTAGATTTGGATAGGATAARPALPEDGRTVARSGAAGSSSGAPLIQGVGSLPAGLVAPMPVRPPDDAEVASGAASPQPAVGAASAGAPSATPRRERTAAERRSRRTALVAAGAVLAVVAIGAIGAAIWPTPPTTTTTTSSTTTRSLPPPPGAIVPAPQNVTLSAPDPGGFQFVTWDPVVGDTSLYEYQIRSSPSGAPAMDVIGTDRAVLAPTGVPASCVTVVAVARDLSGSSEAAQGCIPAQGQ